MPRIIFNRYLFLRTPALSYLDYESSCMADLLKEQFFQSAIFFASESLYSELKRCGFNYMLLDGKVKLSLQKYFNRMCYRPTPFGMFSAFTSLTWNMFEDSLDCILDDSGKVYINPDFQFTADLARKIEESGEVGNVRYCLNSAIYSIKSEKRYLAQYYDSKQKKTDFFINSFETNRLLNKLFNFCRDGRTKQELTAWLNNLVDDLDEVVSYIDDLVKEGILVSELCPNMSGEKYFERLTRIVLENGKNSGLVREITAYGELLSHIRAGNGPDLKKMAGNELYALGKKKFKSMFYVAYEKSTTSSLEKKYQQFLHEGLDCLIKLNIDEPIKSLGDFTTRFRQRYEDQEIPVLQALDHEAGIGYKGLENNLVPSELLDGIQLDLQTSSLSFSWTSVHEFFLSKLVEINRDEHLVISGTDLTKIKEQSHLKIPPSFSAIFRVFGNKVWIEQAGGCTSTALLGRFTLFNEKVLEEARYVAAIEEKTNEDVIFAEISCFNDEHAANINSNAGIRNYEIPIGVHSTYHADNIISLSDLTISVVDSHIFLRSKKLNKIVIPRLSSAFNYSRSELTVFRFLCDLQYQDLKFNFNLDLRSLLPGLKYYPRVEYKNCILFPATWILGVEEINELLNGSGKDSFVKISNRIRLNKHFALTEGDNQLLFDKDNLQSVDLFLQVIKNKKQAVLQEVFIDEEAKIKDSHGKPYIGQFIASVFADEVTYSQMTSPKLKLTKHKAKRIYLPGDEWVYFKVYCHPAVSNGILIKDVKRIVATLKRQKILKSWFFIRYADPDHHLRIRIHINPKDAARVVSYFEKSMRTQVEKGHVNNLTVDTYKRELERYGNDTIQYAENVFNASSEQVIGYLKNLKMQQTEFSEFHLAIISVDALLAVLFSENSDKVRLLKLLHDGMKQEFDDNKQLKFQLDNKYRENSAFFNNINKSKPVIIGLIGKKEFDNYLAALELLKINAQDLTTLNMMKLAGDLIHMDLNRLFNDRQRNHEFIIYYLLYKYYLSVEARKGKGLIPFTPTFKGFGVNHVSESLFK